MLRVFPALFLLIISCKIETANLSSETIFQIPAGMLRDEINLFSRKNFLYNENINFTITPLGSYYIADQSSRKIMFYSNHGRLNYIIYNPKFRFDSEKNQIKYLDKAWNLGEISVLAANLSKLHVASTIPDEEQYKQFILTFDDKGNFVHKLGMGGIDSEPFDYRIVRLSLDEGGNLFAITRKPEAYTIYRFSTQGTLLSNFELSVGKSILPKIQVDDGNSFFEITSPRFSVSGDKLYFELYHYSSEANDATLLTNQLSISSYDIYSLDIDKPYESLEKNFTVRKFGSSKQAYGEELIGTTDKAMLAFLQVHSNGRNAIVYYDTRGKRQYSVTIDVEQKAPYKLYLAPNGLVSALNFYEDRIGVSWWRTDKLFNKELSF